MKHNARKLLALLLALTMLLSMFAVASGEQDIIDLGGEIVIEGLRIGNYTVSEVANEKSENYVLPADKDCTIFEGATTKVEMHNELRDTPKTGDDSNPALWVALMGISGVAAIACAVCAYKKSRKN